MRSPVNWALLGLIIERESYAYELFRRFESIYRRALTLSSTSHVYTALGVLEERALVEQVPSTRGGRQPKPSYRATAEGIQSYGEWLVSHVREDRRRQVLFVLGLSALAGDLGRLGAVLDGYERAWQALEDNPEPLELDDAPEGPGATLAGLIVPEEHALTVAAKLTWTQYVRRTLGALAAEPPQDCGRGPRRTG
jgi:DNA-binding PadR family transcriptional regulator